MYLFKCPQNVKLFNVMSQRLAIHVTANFQQMWQHALVFNGKNLEVNLLKPMSERREEPTAFSLQTFLASSVLLFFLESLTQKCKSNDKISLKIF